MTTVRVTFMFTGMGSSSLTGTSAAQFYRLLDPANTKKSMGQLIALLHILGCEVEVSVKDRAAA